MQSLIVRLEPYCEGGAFAHLTDARTTVPDETTLTLFDIAGLPDRLVPPMILQIVEHIEGAIQRTRSLRLQGELNDGGAWAGRTFLVVEEGWKLTASAAAGAWLNEYARRSRHYALWLIFVSQFFRDLATAQGYALLENKAIALCFQNDADDLEHARAPLALTDADIEHITTLTTRPGLCSSAYMISNRGRGTVRQLLGDLEYWICCSDPRTTSRAAPPRWRRPAGTTGPRSAAVHTRVARAIPRARTSRVNLRALAQAPMAAVAPSRRRVHAHRAARRAPRRRRHRAMRATPAPGGERRRRRRLDRHRLRAAVGRHERQRRHRHRAEPHRRTARVRDRRRPRGDPAATFAHVQPNPFGTTRAFYAGDTGGAIIGRHVDIYDWKGRADQNAWGVRHVDVTPAPNPGAGNLLQEITPGPTTLASSSQPDATIGSTAACDQLAATATLATVPGQTARILADGTAAAPSDAPAAVKLAIAAANEIHTKPYPEPVAHFGSLASPWPAYDCSGAVSFVLYRAGLHSPSPDVSGTLESWASPEPAPGSPCTPTRGTRGS